MKELKNKKVMPQVKTLSIALLVFTLSAFGQPRFVTQIIVPVDFSQAINKSLEAGYTFELIEKDFQIAKTYPRLFFKPARTIIISLRTKDSLLVITGKILIDGVGEVDISNKGMKGSPMKEAFNKMNEFALSFGKPLTYGDNTGTKSYE